MLYPSGVASGGTPDFSTGGTRFSNRYVSALVTYYRRLPTSDKGYFASFLRDQLTTSGFLPCATLLRIGELERVATTLEGWVYFSRAYVSCLQTIRDTLQCEDECFTESQLQRLGTMCSRIQERIRRVRDREDERRAELDEHPVDSWAAHFWSPQDEGMIGMVDDVATCITRLVHLIPFSRYEKLIQASGTLVGFGSEPLLVREPLNDAPRAHLQKACAFLAGPCPDFANAAKEAITAVESRAKIVTGESDLTLGRLIPRLKDQHGLPSVIAKSLQAIWGYTSDAPGVRHGGITPPTITEDIARYVVRVSAAALELLEGLPDDLRPGAPPSVQDG